MDGCVLMLLPGWTLLPAVLVEAAVGIMGCCGCPRGMRELARAMRAMGMRDLALAMWAPMATW